MSDCTSLKNVIEDGINLYEELGIQVDSPDDFHNLGVYELRKRYKSMALKHHPDKLLEGNDSANKFIRLKQAFEILSNPRYREQYNQWFTTRFFGDAKRTLLIRDLEARERNARKTTIIVPGSKVQSIQEHGLYLRKLRHFKKPYGDWQQIVAGHNKGAQLHKLRDSCTLRIFAIRSKATSEEAEIAKLFGIAHVTINEVYFSSRNKHGDSELVFYVVLPDVETLKDFLENWSDKEPLKYHFLEVAPYIKTQHFHFRRPIEKTDVSVEH